MESELFEIPYQALVCYRQNKGLILPEKVPYIGMGASYYATLVLRYQGKKVYPEMASEYFNYLDKARQFDRAVLISQSGESSETLWCANCFSQFVPVVNSLDSSLARHPKADFVVEMCAGAERHSSTKTFINTLVVLLLGHDIDPQPALISMNHRFPALKLIGEDWAKRFFRLQKRRKYKGFFILGSGPNVGTAMQAALVLSETTKIPFQGMALAQFDYGMKEAAGKSVVFVINGKENRNERVIQLVHRIEQAGGVCFELNEDEITESLSPFITVIPFFFMASSLKKRLKIEDEFIVGEKVTRVKIRSRLTGF